MQTENEEIELNEEEVVEEARSMGWVPEEEFKGKKENWVSAEEYVERGRHIIPIMQANNKRMRQEVLTYKTQVGTLHGQVESLTGTLNKITARLAQSEKAKLKEQKREITRQIGEARKDENTELEFQLVENLETIKKQEEELEQESKEDKGKKAPNPTQDQNENFTPEMKAWFKDNPWYGKDRQKTKEYTRLAEDLREEGETAEGVEFLELLDEEYKKRHADEGDNSSGKSRKSSVNKVENGSPRGSAGSSGTGKSWASLPKEAREACLDFADDLVGEGKAYKTLDDWKKKYIADYFADGEE